jgi:O-methyltransferase involved in polyketide biosynthesis
MTVQAVQAVASPQLGGVAETAFAPLVARALAAEIAPDFGFRDRTAEAIYRSLQPELAPHRAPRAAMLAMIATTWVIDQLVGSFTSRHPHAQIVDLGAGLSTRFQRIDNGMVTWIDVDLPEVVTLRQTLFPYCDRRQMIGVDVGTPAWAERLELRPVPTLIVAEGLFAYAPPATTTSVLADLAATTGRRTELLFDFTNRLLARRLSLRPAAGAAAGPTRRGVRRHADLVRDGWQLMRIHPVYQAMGFPYSLLGAALGKVTRCCPHGVAHLVCTTERPARRGDDGEMVPAS